MLKIVILRRFLVKQVWIQLLHFIRIWRSHWL